MQPECSQSGPRDTGSVHHSSRGTSTRAVALWGIGLTPVLFVVAAAAGAVLRWQVSARLPRPLGTLAVNLVGAFALGLLVGLDEPVVTVFGVGGLGALTTFSTFADDVVLLAKRSYVRAVIYVMVTVVGGVCAAALGISI